MLHVADCLSVTRLSITDPDGPNLARSLDTLTHALY